MSGHYLSTYSPEVADYVRIRKPKTTIEMANLVQQYFDGKRDRRQFRRPFERSGLRDDSERVDPFKGKQGEQHERGGGNVRQEPGKGKDERDGDVGALKCFNCGKRGHKKFECPNKVARVTSPGRIG